MSLLKGAHLFRYNILMWIMDLDNTHGYVVTLHLRFLSIEDHFIWLKLRGKCPPPKKKDSYSMCTIWFCLDQSNVFAALEKKTTTKRSDAWYTSTRAGGHWWTQNIWCKLEQLVSKMRTCTLQPHVYSPLKKKKAPAQKKKDDLWINKMSYLTGSTVLHPVHHVASV